MVVTRSPKILRAVKKRYPHAFGIFLDARPSVTIERFIDRQGHRADDQAVAALADSLTLMVRPDIDLVAHREFSLRAQTEQAKLRRIPHNLDVPVELEISVYVEEGPNWRLKDEKTRERTRKEVIGYVSPTLSEYLKQTPQRRRKRLRA